MQYTIKHGDTLSQIALDHGVSVDDLMSANPQITNANMIIAGARMEVPAFLGVGKVKSGGMV